jgi:hypothetical protein
MILFKYLIITEKYNNRELSIWTCRNTAQGYIKLLLSIGYTKEEVQLYKLLKWPLFSKKIKTYSKIIK